MISAFEGDNLIVTAIGYTALDVTVGNASSITVTLQRREGELIRSRHHPWALNAKRKPGVFGLGYQIR